MKTNKNILITAILLIVGMALVVPASAALYWDIETVAPSGACGSYISLAFDGEENPVISYYNTSNSYLNIATKEGDDWTVTSIGEKKYAGVYASLSVLNGHPAISYRDCNDPVSLKYAWENATGWYNSTVENVNAFYTSLAFNQTGTPAISYYDQNNALLKYAWKNGGIWETEIIENRVELNTQGTSLAFDSDNKPIVSYCDCIEGKYWLKYAYKEENSWQTTTIDDVDGGKYPSLAFNETSGYPAISYCDDAGSKLKSAWMDGEGWHKITIDDGLVDGVTSLAFHNSLPAISYYRDGDLGYAWMDGEGWHNMSADDGNTADDSIGKWSSLAFTSDGRPAISYLDQNLNDPDTPFHDLKYAVGTLPPTTLRVTSSPRGAAIYLDETTTGKVTPFDLTTGLTAGTYNVTVILDGYEPGINNSVNVVENETTSVHFDLEPIPDVNFTATPLTGTNPLTVQFNDTTNIDCFDWEWDFGDGTTVFNEQNPVHIYNATGFYTVTLTVGSEYLMDEESEVPGSDEPNRKTKIDYITVTDPAPSPTPTQVIHRGGGGGGDSQFEFKEGTGILLTSDEGKILHKTIYISRDGIAKLTLGQDIFARGSDGEPLPEITIEPINASEVPSNPNGTFTFAGLAYRCTPSGATFSPAIILSLTLSADEWDALGEGDFSIRFYDEKTKEWIELPVTVDHENHTITAKITHFSIFGLFTSTGSATTIAQAQPTVTPGITVSTDALTETQGGTTTASEPTKSAPLVCVPLIGLGALAILRKRL